MAKKIKAPKINITNLHKLPIEQRLDTFAKLEEKFFKRFATLKKELTFRNSKYDDVYSQKEDIVKLQFEIHRQNIMNGKLPKGTRTFLSKINMLSTGDIASMVLEKANATLDEYLNSIKQQSYEEYLEAVELINNMSDEQKRRFVKERGFFISSNYDSEGRDRFADYIKKGNGDYDTDTIEMYKIKYFLEHNTLTTKRQLSKMSEKKRNRSKYRI